MPDHVNLNQYNVIYFGQNMICSVIHVLIMETCDVINWEHFPRNWPFVRGIHRSPVNSPRKGQWRGALIFSLFAAWISGWVNNGETGDLRRHRAHYDVIVMNDYEYTSDIPPTYQSRCCENYCCIPATGREIWQLLSFEGHSYMRMVCYVHFEQWKSVNFKGHQLIHSMSSCARIGPGAVPTSVT